MIEVAIFVMASQLLTTQFVVAVLGAGGLGAIAAAVIAGLFSKRKLGAEATEIITKAAAGVVVNLQDELNRSVKAREDAALQWRLDRAALMEAWEAERVEVRRVLQLHVAWDAIAIAEMSKIGVDLPPAPPLLPAHRPTFPGPAMPDGV